MPRPRTPHIAPTKRAASPVQTRHRLDALPDKQRALAIKMAGGIQARVIMLGRASFAVVDPDCMPEDAATA